jgi:hypothetical protein
LFGSIFLKREEAINLIKEITDEKCTNIVGHDIILIQPNANDKISQGYQLHIKTILDKASLRCLQVILDQDGYALKNDLEKGLIVIFKPAGSREYPDNRGIM